MELSRLDLNLLLAFEAIAAERNVTRAARRLGLGQPAMSAALARLRAALGDDLFRRVAGRMEPTPRAAALLPGILGALAALRATLAQAPFDPAASARRFAIAASDHTSLTVLPAVVARLRAAAPAVELQILPVDKDAIGGQLERGEIDLALGTFQAPPPRAVMTRLYEERFVGLARQGHPALVGGVMTAERFCAHPHALFTIRADWRGEIDRALARQGLRRRVALSLPYLLALPALLAASDLLAAVPSRLATTLGGGGVQAFALPVDIPPWRVAMLWSAARRQDAALAWLRGVVRAAAAG